MGVDAKEIRYKHTHTLKIQPSKHRLVAKAPIPVLYTVAFEFLLSLPIYKWNTAKVSNYRACDYTLSQNLAALEALTQGWIKLFNYLIMWFGENN